MSASRLLFLLSIVAAPAIAAASAKAQAPAANPACVSGAEIDALVGRDMRLTTFTGAVWTGTLTEAGAEWLTLKSGAGAVFPVPRGGVRCVQVVTGPRSDDQAVRESPSGTLRIHGSNTIGRQLVPNLLEAYALDGKLPGVQVLPGRVEQERTILFGGAESRQMLTVDLQSHGTGTAFVSLQAKAADLGMASRPVNDKERDAVQAAGLGDLRAVGQEHVIALDGLAVIVHPGNPLRSLTLRQIEGLFRGTITDWAEIGGAPGRVSVYSREEKSGTFDTFNELVLRRRPLAPTANLFEDSVRLSDSVAADPGGIGFIGLAYVGAARAVGITQGCGLTVPADAFTVKTEEYPLARRLYLYSPAQPSPQAASFLAFVQKPAAQPIVGAADFVNLLPELAPPAYGRSRAEAAGESFGQSPAAAETARAAARANELRGIFGSARRLSITFRFQHESDALDTRAEADIRRLVAWAGDKANAGRQIVLIGYSSAVGLFDPNVALARGRANAVAKRLRDNGLQPAAVVAAGPIGAVACNDGDRGEALNRRVEVWVR